MRARKVMLAVGGVVLALAAGGAAIGLYILASVADTVLHGDEATQRRAAADTLSCESSRIEISGLRAVGCGRACLLETTGSSASWWSSYTCVLEVASSPVPTATEDAGAMPLAAAADGSRPGCHDELAAFCRLEKCASYDETKAASAALAKAPRAPELGEELRVEVGTCDGLRFVSRADTSYGWKQLFDANGVLTGAVRWGDSKSYCQGTAFRSAFGNVPDACL